MNFLQRAFSYLSGNKGAGTDYRIGNRPLTLAEITGVGTIGGKVAVTPDSALGLAALLNCHSNLARDISTLPTNLYKKTDKGNKIQHEHPLYKLIHVQPNKSMTAQTWKQLQMWRACKYGNSFNIIER